MGKKYSKKDVIFVGQVFNMIEKHEFGYRILRLYDKGYSYSEISEKTGISEAYIKTYVELKKKIIQNRKAE